MLKIKIDNFHVPENYSLISLDVKSLFTNINKKLAKKAIEYFHEKHKNCFQTEKMLISKKIFVECMMFVIENTYFQNNNRFFKQDFGVPIGLPVNPIVTDMVMEILELSCLEIIKKEYDVIL